MSPASNPQQESRRHFCAHGRETPRAPPRRGASLADAPSSPEPGWYHPPRAHDSHGSTQGCRVAPRPLLRDAGGSGSGGERGQPSRDLRGPGHAVPRGSAPPRPAPSTGTALGAAAPHSRGSGRSPGDARPPPESASTRRGVRHPAGPGAPRPRGWALPSLLPRPFPVPVGAGLAAAPGRISVLAGTGTGTGTGALGRSGENFCRSRGGGGCGGSGGGTGAGGGTAAEEPRPAAPLLPPARGAGGGGGRSPVPPAPPRPAPPVPGARRCARRGAACAAPRHRRPRPGAAGEPALVPAAGPRRPLLRPAPLPGTGFPPAGTGLTERRGQLERTGPQGRETGVPAAPGGRCSPPLGAAGSAGEGSPGPSEAAGLRGSPAVPGGFPAPSRVCPPLHPHPASRSCQCAELAAPAAGAGLAPPPPPPRGPGQTSAVQPGAASTPAFRPPLAVTGRWPPHAVLLQHNQVNTSQGSSKCPGHPPSPRVWSVAWAGTPAAGVPAADPPPCLSPWAQTFTLGRQPWWPCRPWQLGHTKRPPTWTPASPAPRSPPASAPSQGVTLLSHPLAGSPCGCGQSGPAAWAHAGACRCLTSAGGGRPPPEAALAPLWVRRRLWRGRAHSPPPCPVRAEG